MGDGASEYREAICTTGWHEDRHEATGNRTYDYVTLGKLEL